MAKLSAMRVYEKLWIIAAVCSLGVFIYNLISLKSFVVPVYFPFMCSIFCLLLFITKRNHRIFLEKHEENKKQTNP